MMIGERLRTLRLAKSLSQGDIERRTGLIRCYISRVENGHTVPAVETLEKFARALEVPMYRIFYDGEVEQPPSNGESLRRPAVRQWGSSGREARVLARFRVLLARIDSRNHRLLLMLARTMATHDSRQRRRRSPSAASR